MAIYNYYKNLEDNIENLERKIDIETENKLKKSVEFMKFYLPINTINYNKVMEKYNGIYFTTDLRNGVKNYNGASSSIIKELIRMLCADTMIIFNWIFD